MLNWNITETQEEISGFCDVFTSVYIALEPLPYPVFWLIIKKAVMREDGLQSGISAVFFCDGGVLRPDDLDFTAFAWKMREYFSFPVV